MKRISYYLGFLVVYVGVLANLSLGLSKVTPVMRGDLIGAPLEMAILKELCVPVSAILVLLYMGCGLRDNYNKAFDKG